MSIYDSMKNIRNKNILVFGDFMVDQYIDGNVDRISPEAPVPVLHVTKKWSKLGGAANVAENLVSMGANVSVAGFLGEDLEGDWIISSLVEKNVDVSNMYQYQDLQTIAKIRITSRKQQFIRIDEEEIKDISYKHIEDLKINIKNMLQGIDLVIISDYGKGSVIQETSQLLIQQATKNQIPVIVDPKGKDYLKYQNATLITPNTKELSDVSGRKCTDEEELMKAGKKLRKQLNLKYLIVTRSEKGMTVFEENSIETFPAINKEVVDVSGAGDTVVSAIACLYACGFPIQDCCKLANVAASIVCSKFGTATVSLNEWMGQIVGGGDNKYISEETAKFIIRDLKEKGKTVVFTNGCFDMLHAGHLSSFKQAKQMGDVLIVAVNSDASVHAVKGPSRPIIDEKNRIEMICALECVDYVVLMEEDNPIHLIETLKPSITVKGKDWENKYLPEREVVESYGGQVKFIELNGNLSTTNIIHKILGEEEELK